MLPPDQGTARQPIVVVLDGTPEEMGLAHGRLLGRQIRHLLGQMETHIFRRVDLLRGTGVRVLMRALASLLNFHIPARLRDEMRGIAAGSGIGYADLLLVNTIDDTLNILRRLAPRSPSLGCSSFAIFGRHTRDGGVIHGRNLDYHFHGTPLDDAGAVARLLLKSTVLFVYRPTGHAAFVSIGWPGTVGVTTAISQERISLGNLTSYLPGTTPNGTPTSIVYRNIIEEARTLQEAGSILRLSRRTIGNNLLVSSGRENRATLFELTRDTVEEVFPADGYLVTTNHFTSPTLARRQRPYLLGHSVTRQERLEALCCREAVGPEEAADFLADCDCGPAGNLFARIANEGTAVSALFSPSTMEMWLGTAARPPASSGKFVRIHVEELLRSRPQDELPQPPDPNRSGSTC